MSTTVMSPSTLSITVIETPWSTELEGHIYRDVDGHWEYVRRVERHLPASELAGSGTLMLVAGNDVNFWTYTTSNSGDVHFEGPYTCRP